MPVSEDDRKLIESFWKEYIDGFIFNDLNNCVRAGANYLVALGEMCYIDFLGKLMTGKANNSQGNFKRFVRAYLPQYSRRVFLNKLYREFRSGLVHAYFPENVDVVAVMKPLPVPPSIWRERGKWKIVVADFLDEFKKAADALKKDLLAGKHLKQFKKVVSESPGLERIPKWPTVSGTPVTSTTVTTYSSGFITPPIKPPDE